MRQSNSQKTNNLGGKKIGQAKGDTKAQKSKLKGENVGNSVERNVGFKMWRAR